MTAPDPKTVREIATEHIRSGRIDIGTTVELMLIGVILDREELAAWENAVQQAIRAAVPSWPDDQQPADVVTAEQQPWPRAQRMPLAVVGQHVQPWHHQAIAEYGAATGTELEPNPTIPGGYTAAQVNRAITWWNERVTAEQQQDGAATEAAGRVAAFCDALDHYGDDGNPIASEHNPDGDPDTVLYLSLTKQDLRAVLAERTALATRVAELTAKAQEPHHGLTEDAFVQLLSERTGQPVLLCIGDSRPIAGGIHAGYALDSVKLGDKEVGRVTLQTVFPGYVITGPTPENEARRQQLLAELDAMEAALEATETEES